jgi:hypothetical protein
VITISTASETEAQAAARLAASWPPDISYEVFLNGRRVAGRRAASQPPDTAQWGQEPELR